MKDTFINCARELKIAVIGDIMLDVYIDGTVERLSPEAPNCIVLDETKRRYAVGGAGNVAHNLARFGVKTRLCGTLGTMENEQYHMVLADRIKQVCDDTETMFGSLEFFPIAEAGTRLCTVKKRFRSEGQQLLRVDREHRHPVVLGADPDGDSIGDTLKRAIDGVDAVILSDYGKGMLSDAVLAFLLPLLRKREIPYFVDPKRTNLLDYCQIGGAIPEAVCPNHNEWVHSKQHEAPMGLTAARAIIVTDGCHGCYHIGFDEFLQSWTQKYHKLKHEVSVADPAGAGDTFVAALTVAMMSSYKTNKGRLCVDEACQIANCLASLTVVEHGIVVPDLLEAGLLIDSEVFS